MARKKDPAKPYNSIKHEHADSLKAFEDAAMMLHNMVNTALSLAKTPEQSHRLIASLKEHNENFRRAAFGED